jgi:hypothetical protein
VVVYAVGLDDQVYQAALPGSGTAGFSYRLYAHGQVRSLKAGAVGPDGYPLLLALGLDGQVYFPQFLSYRGVVTTLGYSLFASGVVKSFDVTGDAQGATVVYAVGLDDQVYRAAMSVNAYGVPAAVSYALAAAGQVRAAAAGRDAAGNPLLLALGLDGQVYRASSSSYQLAAPGVVQAFEVGRDPAGGPELAAVGLDAQAYGLPLDASGAPAGGYSLLSNGQVRLLRLPR